MLNLFLPVDECVMEQDSVLVPDQKSNFLPPYCLEWIWFHSVCSGGRKRLLSAETGERSFLGTHCISINPEGRITQKNLVDGFLLALEKSRKPVLDLPISKASSYINSDQLKFK